MRNNMVLAQCHVLAYCKTLFTLFFGVTCIVKFAFVAFSVLSWLYCVKFPMFRTADTCKIDYERKKIDIVRCVR